MSESQSELVLYSYNVSPYAAKVRAILAWKQLPFREVIVHPLWRRELRKLSGQWLVPVLQDGGRVVADSTRIVAHLDEAHPERRVLPEDPIERGRARLLEEWADEGLPSVVQPVRWLIPMNFERSLARMRSAYPPGRAGDLTLKAVGQVLRLDMARRYGPRVGFGKPAHYLNRLAEVLDIAEAAIGPEGFLVGGAPTVADFSLAAWVSLLRGLDGSETVRVRRKVTKLAKLLIPESQESSEEGKKLAGATKEGSREAYDAETQALIDASRLRRSERGQL
jgi:glutathione S-transferase